MDWDKLKYFHEVAKFASFTHAAKHLNLTQSSLSRSIHALEQELKVTLFERSPRHLKLTKEGQILFQCVKNMMTHAEIAQVQMQECHDVVRGDLRIAATMGFTTLYLSPYLADFVKAYPEVSLSIFAEDKAPDLEFYEADAIIAPHMPESSAIVQTYIMTVHLKLYASPEYLKQHGVPEKPEDLDHHRIIAFGRHQHHPFGKPDWSLTIGAAPGVVRKPILEANVATTRCYLAQAGLGITMLSQEHPGLSETNLVEVLPNVPCPTIDMYYIYRKDLESVRRVRAFEQFLQEIFHADQK